MATRPARTGGEPAPVAHRFFELIPPNTKIDFVGLRFKMLVLSWSIILIGLASVWLKGGLNYGIDFAGGTMVHVKFTQPTPIGDIRSALSRPELKEVIVQDVGKGGQEFQIRVVGAEHGGATAIADGIKTGLKERFGEGTYDVLRVETVGPKVGKDLWRSAALAVLVATLVMGAYIAFRFEFRFGVGAAIALIHDVLMTIGALSLANMEFDLTTVAALLTVVGYSVHDTVIVSDRIRENMK
jgi:preprotein translocase subunit SecF